MSDVKVLKLSTHETVVSFCQIVADQNTDILLIRLSKPYTFEKKGKKYLLSKWPEHVGEDPAIYVEPQSVSYSFAPNAALLSAYNKLTGMENVVALPVPVKG